MTAEPSHLRYRFGRFELQPDERYLLDAGASVAVSPRAFDLLVPLVQAPGTANICDSHASRMRFPGSASQAQMDSPIRCKYAS